MATTDLSATTTITFEQLTKYFHLPINDVAKELGICATMLKKICRKNGIPRWPHRKIKSLNKMIENLEASLQNNASEAEECILQEINILKNKKSLIMKNPSILVQGGSTKRALGDQDGKIVKKPRASDGEDVPVATITIPKSSSVPSSSPGALSINQLLTPTNPFSTPLTSYLLSNEEKDDKGSPRRADEATQQLVVRPPSPSGQSPYYKSPRQQAGYFLPSHPNMPPDYHNFRASVEFLTSTPPYAQQTQAQPQQQPGQEPMPYVLPKLNFSPTASQQPNPYLNPPGTPKFRPPSPMTSSHQPSPTFAAPTAEGFPPRHAPAHFFHHYHPQLPTSNTFKPYAQPQPQPVPQQPHPPPPSQAPAQQQTQPVVLRWVMEYDKPANKK